MHPVQLIKLKHIVDQLKLYQQSIINDEHDLVADGPAREARARQLVQMALAIGFILNIVVAIFLARFFARGIKSRVNCIIDNTTRVPKGLPLNKPLQGGDEMAQLDSYFHSMVNELDESRQMQRYLIAIVSHDLRSPLTSMQGLLTLLNAGAWGELPEAALEKVCLGRSDATRLIALTNDLLDTERLAFGKFDMHFSKANVAETIKNATESVQALQTTQGQH